MPAGVFVAHEPQPETSDDLFARHADLVAMLRDTATAPVSPTAAPAAAEAPRLLPLAAGRLLPAGLGFAHGIGRPRRPSARRPCVHQA